MSTPLNALVTLACVAVVAPPALSKSRVTVGELTADGLTVRDLACDLDEGGGLLAGALIVGALAKQRAAFEACGPSGEAVDVRFRWRGAKAEAIEVVAASDAAAGRCVKRTLATVEPAMAGSCRLILLTAATDKGKASAEALRPAAVPPAAPDDGREEPEAPPDSDWAKHYADPTAWDVITQKTQRWALWVPRGTEMKDAWLDVHGERWRGAVGEHQHQLLWVFWHPTLPLDDATVDALTHEAVTKSRGFRWIHVETIPAREGFPKTMIHKALASPHRFLRVVANGDGGAHFLLALFSERMPDEVVHSWLRSITFLPAE